MAMETHFMKLPMNSSCAGIASRGSLELCSVLQTRTDDVLHAARFNTGRSRSVNLCGLPLRGWAVVAPRHVYFTITALACWPGQLLQGRNFRNWLVGKVVYYNAATLKVTELFSKVMLLPMFVYGDCVAVCSTCTYSIHLSFWVKRSVSEL
jgi:hypothetical protein